MEVIKIKLYKGYKIRLYPTKEQEELMWKHNVGLVKYKGGFQKSYKKIDKSKSLI